MARPIQKTTTKSKSGLVFPRGTELVGIELALESLTDLRLPLNYAVGCHAWFLQQVQQDDGALSAYMHDGESEKPFTLSGLMGPLVLSGQRLKLAAGEVCYWRVTALSVEVVRWLRTWLKRSPDRMELGWGELRIRGVRLVYPALSYAQLWQMGVDDSDESKVLELSFTSPTSFRRKGHHLPLPWPGNMFHSYLRRWNHFSSMPIDQEDFLAWVDEHTVIHRVVVTSAKVAAGKQGAVTGFTGAIALGISRSGRQNREFTQLFYTLGAFAPYCGTGHKTPFGLGQTVGGWQVEMQEPELQVGDLLGQRIVELTDIFMGQRRRQGGQRARHTAERWATILARREFGEMPQEIAEAMELKLDTVKSYLKLARRSLKDEV